MYATHLPALLFSLLFPLQGTDDPIESALRRASENRAQIEEALEKVPADQRAGMRFLVEHMPVRDLQSLRAKFLLENVALAYRAWREAPWGKQVPEEVFFNDVLPYASVNEARDDWRREFHDKFRPMVEEVESPGRAAAILNQKIFPELKVKYSTKRRRADQGPRESIESGLASCTGLSILLIDACRSVGVPARFVGTPRWSDGSGNHSWVEVWDGGWHFTGAAEPTGDELDKAWFTGRAAQAKRDDRMNAIYAVSYRKTPITFPLVWARRVENIHAVNVTNRYTIHRVELPEGKVRVRLRVRGSDGERVQADLTIRDAQGEPVFVGQTHDERFDANDHCTVILAAGEVHRVEVREGSRSAVLELTPSKDEELVTVGLENPTKDEIQAAAGELREEHRARIRRERAGEMKARELEIDGKKMPFAYTVFGDKPEGGRSLFISMHGGGGAPTRVNDRQWENQKKLYEPKEGVYLAPRAPTDAWNLWHQTHIDPLFDRLIENLIVFEDVDPNRVYLLGYSAGGDGVYQLAPRMADRFAAAAMMAGHPNEARPLGLRNLPFTLHMGGKDGAYKRNEVAKTWGEKLAKLREEDPQGYLHSVKIHADKGHWMDREDAAALPWMAKHTRDPLPSKIVWYQDDVTHSRFYWLAVDPEHRHKGSEVRATLNGQRIDLQAQGVEKLTIRLNDDMLDLDRPVVITAGEEELFRGLVARSREVLAKTLAERGDPSSIFCAEVTVTLPSSN